MGCTRNIKKYVFNLFIHEITLLMYNILYGLYFITNLLTIQIILRVQITFLMANGKYSSLYFN